MRQPTQPFAPAGFALSANAYAPSAPWLMGVVVPRPHDGAHRQPACRRLQTERQLTNLSHTLDSNHPPGHAGGANADARTDGAGTAVLPGGLPAGPLFKAAPWWGRPPARPGIPYLSESLAALVAVSLLLLFFFVVRGSVAQGERLRVAMATHSAATHHCNSLAALGSGEACLRLLNATANAGVAQANSMASIAAR